VDEIFRRLSGRNFSELRGLTVDASIPVPELLLNEIIAAIIRGDGNISHLELFVYSQNRVFLNLKTTLWPWPLALKLRLDNQVDFRGAPAIKARLENKVLLARLGSFLKALPAGISLHNDEVVLDIASFLPTPELKSMLDLVRSADIKTEAGKVILDVRIEVGDDNESVS
jgi:hypothetical protein